MDKLEVLRQWIEEEWNKSCDDRAGFHEIREAIARLQFLDSVDKVMDNAGYPGSVWHAYWADGNSFHSRDFKTLDGLLFPPEDSE